MAGKACGDPALTTEPSLAPDVRRRLAVARLIIAVPALFLCVFAVVAAFRMTGRPLGDWALWLALAPVLLGFAGLVAHALWQLKTGKPK